MAAVLGPIDTVFANKFIHALAETDESPRIIVQASSCRMGSKPPKTDTFKMGPELLYGGQGKINNNINRTPNTATPGDEGGITTAITINMAMGHEGLEPPRLKDTNEEVTGDDKRCLCKQNKQRKRRLKATQQRGGQWKEHTGQVEYKSTPLPRTQEPHRNFMCPTGRALIHPAANLLHDWATLGCPTRTGRNWTKEEIWEAVERGPH